MTTAGHLPACLGIALVLAAFVGCATDPEQSGRHPPNLLLISLDACRADHLGCYGYGRETSPFLDELAARGTRFANAFVNTHGTPPSHTTMLTSLYQQTHGVGMVDPANPRVNQVPEAAVMVQEVLAQEGWTTLAVTGGGFVGDAFGFDRGFDVFEHQTDFEQSLSRIAELVREHGASGRPMLVFFHTYEIHSPYLPPAEYAQMFDDEPTDFEPTSENLLRVANSARRELSPADLAHVEALYDAGIRFVDDGLRRLFAELEDIGFLERASVVITADHGEELAEHGGMLHRSTLYEELIHVPLILVGSGVPARRVDDTLASTVDIVPTLLARAGIDPFPEHRGRDLLGDDPPPDAVFSQYADQRYAVRTGRWKLIETPARGRIELYDLVGDPEEQRNVARRRPETVADLQAKLDAWRASCPPLDEEPVSPELTDPDLERLRTLGYVE